MGLLDGIKQLLLRTGEPTGQDPQSGKIYKWVEKVGAEHIYKGKDSAGNVFNIGTNGVAGLWETSNGSIQPIDNKDVAVGKPGEDAEFFAGRGKYYNDEIKVLTFDGSSYLDETSKILTRDDALYVEFPNTAPSSAIYVCSDKFVGSDYLKDSGAGLRLKTTQALNEGAGEVKKEYYNGASWVEFDHMHSEYAGDYTLGHLLFSEVGNHHDNFDVAVVNNIQKVTINSLERYWIRYRIESTITTSMRIDYLKLHTASIEIGKLGRLRRFCLARETRFFSSHYGSYQAAVNSPSNQDLYLSDGLFTGMKENSFVNGVTDETGVFLPIPKWVDTSSKVKLIFKFRGTSATAGDVRFNIKHGMARAEDGLYGDTSGPSTFRNEVEQFGTFPFGSGESNKIKIVTLYLDISEVTFDNGEFYFLAITFGRLGADVLDTYPGNVSMALFDIEGVAWRDGGSVSSF